MYDSIPARRNVDTPRDAEQLAADWMRYWGYRDALMTPVGRDGGLDVVAGNATAQVKYYAAQIGRPMLQEFVGASYGREGDLLFFTTSAYAKPALEYADQVGMALFVIGPHGQMRPVNESARKVAAREEERRRANAERVRKKEEERNKRAAELAVAREAARKLKEQQKTIAHSESTPSSQDALQNQAIGTTRPPLPRRRNRSWLLTSMLIVCLLVLIFFSGFLPMGIDHTIVRGPEPRVLLAASLGLVATLVASRLFMVVASRMPHFSWGVLGLTIAVLAVLWWADFDGVAVPATTALAVIAGVGWLIGLMRPRKGPEIDLSKP